MSNITINDLNTAYTLSNVESKLLVGGSLNINIKPVVQVGVNFAIFAGIQGIKQIVV
jgi:hypothetical protein